MKVGLSGGYFNYPLEEQIKKFQSMPEFLLYDGLKKRGHEVFPFSTRDIPIQKLDVFHCHHYSRILKYLSIMKRYPLFFTPHNPFIFSSNYTLRLLDRIALKRIDALIVLSELEKQVYVNRFGMSEKVHVIPNGLKVELYERPDKLKSRDKWNISKDRLMILFVGQILPYKGLEYLFKAVENLDVTLVIKSHYSSSIISENILKQAPENTVLIREDLKQKDLSDLYHSCDIYAQPSLAEALPTVITEAMMCGKPILSTFVGGIPEQVPWNCGFIVEPENSRHLRFCLEYLIYHPSRRRSFGDNARKHALEVYNQDKMIDKHIELYSKVSGC
ncbi:Alpha-maltose-1-phosphate synthase [subsurface metagenome]